MPTAYQTGLKPCPFCGSDATLIHGHPGQYGDYGGYSVICTDQDGCWASMSPNSAWWEDKIHAVEAWNRRSE